MAGNRSEGHSKISISRREFLRGVALVGGFTLLSPLVSSCSDDSSWLSEPNKPTKPNFSSVPNEDDNMTKVTLVRTRNRSDGVKRAVSMLNINPVNGKGVVLKPNFNSADPTPGSTHNDTLRSLVQILQEMGAKQVTLSERSGPGDSTRRVMEKKGIFELAREIGFSIINLEEMEPEGWSKFDPKESHWNNGFHFPRIYLDAESVIQTCCLKTHAYGGHFTLSLKNSVGLVPRVGYSYMQELHSSPYQRYMIAEINAAYSPDIVVLDGIEAFVDGGPARGSRVDAEVMLAGTDRVAIDAVGVAILRLLGTTPEVSQGSIFKQEQIERAAELGLGISSSRQIQIVTSDTESEFFAGKLRDVLLSD